MRGMRNGQKTGKAYSDHRIVYPQRRNAVLSCHTPGCLITWLLGYYAGLLGAEHQTLISTHTTDSIQSVRSRNLVRGHLGGKNSLYSWVRETGNAKG